MQIVFDFRFFEDLIKLPPGMILWELFIRGGWLIILVIIIWQIWKRWLTKKQIKYLESIEYTLLAIDVPKENEQGPKAVEQIFAQLAAGESEPKSFKEKYIDGVLAVPFSLEIISLEGYIQFLIRTPTGLRDLVESAVYAQYPDAEITEVEDYVNGAPTEFPSEEYDLWGAELVLYNKQAYPIRTYPSFEDPTAREKFKDPMAALLEVLGKIGSGEQIWLQFLIVPASTDWKKEGDALVRKLLGLSVDTKYNLIDRLIYTPILFLSWLHEQLWGPYGPEKKETLASKMSALSPGERKVIEAIQNKISKLGFKSKIRMLYWANKEFFSKGRGVAAVIGAMKQFNTLDMNGFKPDSTAKTMATNRLFPKKSLAASKKSFLNAYKERNFHQGAKSYVLNTEELATLFHFPMSTVKAPMLKKAEMKSAEAPVSLPTEASSFLRETSSEKSTTDEEQKATVENKGQTPKPKQQEIGNKVELSDKATFSPGGEPPPNLPVVP